MQIPATDATGQRLSVNYGIDELQSVWNFRAAWNVAALNCTSAEDAQIIDAYGSFLTRFSRQLSSVNTALDRRFRDSEGSTRAGTRAREAGLTQVYNYFAQPAARGDFCNTARLVSASWLTTPPTELNSFAVANLALFENAFENFFRQYEEYRTASNAWDRQYGAQYGASQPGYVAVYGTGGAPAATSLMASEVLDSVTGTPIPVIPAAEGSVATPVVQPLSAGVADR
ncbi:MAG TPA: hypothetical protein VLA45_06295 [Paracoccaceae bacterium]|nr:hypothetical protein [Paracoccaceae bacterium]